MLRASAVAEKAGVPTVSIVGSGFLKQAALVSKGLGLPLAIAEYPGVPMIDGEAAVRAKTLENLLPSIINGLTGAGAEIAAPASVAEPRPGSVVYRGSLDEIQEYFHQQLWSDGLPVIPPTRGKVDAFLKFTDRDPAQVLGVLPQEGRQASVLSIAVNAVMAGCRPEYMPLLIAVVEAICDPYWKVEEAGSTTGWEPLVIVNGPIVRELDFNSGAGVMRVGRQANSSIGRFVRLYLRNVCGYRIPPGDGDKASIGLTFNVALAENEDGAREIGWPSFAEDLGFNARDNVVTVQSVVAISSPVYSSGDTAAPHLQQFVDTIGQAFSYWTHCAIKMGYWHPLIVVGPSIARVIAREHTKDDVRRYFWEKATMSASMARHFLKHTSGMELDFGQLVRAGILPRDYIASDDPDRMVRMVVKPEHIGIVVAGDAGRNQSRGYMGNHMHGGRTSRVIELPRAWPQLMKHARKKNLSGH